VGAALGSEDITAFGDYKLATKPATVKAARSWPTGRSRSEISSRFDVRDTGVMHTGYGGGDRNIDTKRTSPNADAPK
jgi:hypothetical protein